jgi:hypothetical protein
MADPQHCPGLNRRQLSAAAALALLAGCGGGNTEKAVDAVLPTLVISSDTPVAATGPFTLRFTFSAAVTGFDTSRIAVSSGLVIGAALTRLSDTVYTLVLTPSANVKGIGTVQVLSGAFEDSTGTLANTQAYSFGQELNTVVIGTEPTLTISHNLSTAAATAPVTFTLSFSTDVDSSFTADDIQLSAGTLTSLTRSSGALWTALVTLPAGTAGQLVLLVGAGSFQNSAGVSNQRAYGKQLPFAIPA